MLRAPLAATVRTVVKLYRNVNGGSDNGSKGRPQVLIVHSCAFNKF